eukprot:5689017-Pleurochrysis_carterae.AAC.8
MRFFVASPACLSPRAQERGARLHRQARLDAGRDARAAHRVRAADPPEGVAAARGRRAVLRDQEGLLHRVRRRACVRGGGEGSAAK